jgi:alpha-tubulin suppressor-like RCC1 family protein
VPDAGDAGDGGSDAADAGAGDAGDGGPELARSTIALGVAHTCALKDESVYCWGANADGQLAFSTSEDRLVPTLVTAAPAKVVEISAGQFHTCVRTADGRVFCWGRGLSGQLGDGRFASSSVPVPMNLPAPAIELKAAYYQTCARLIDGRVTCNGFNGYGALGNGTKGPVTGPGTLLGVAGAAELAVGDQTLCIRRVDHTVVCSGSNRAGSCADGTTLDRTVAVLADVPPATAIGAAGGQLTLVTTAGELVTWGRISIDDPFRGPTPVTSLGANLRIVGLRTPSCAIDTTTPSAGHVACFVEATLAMATVPNVGTVAEYASGDDGHVCARTGGFPPGSIVCYGKNDHGQLGIGSEGAPVATPTAVTGF